MTNPWSESSSKVSILYIDIDHREIDDIKSSVAGVQELFEWQRRKYCLLAHPLQASILYIYIAQFLPFNRGKRMAYSRNLLIPSRFLFTIGHFITVVMAFFQRVRLYSLLLSTMTLFDQSLHPIFCRNYMLSPTLPWRLLYLYRMQIWHPSMPPCQLA